MSSNKKYKPIKNTNQNNINISSYYGPITQSKKNIKDYKSNNKKSKSKYKNNQKNKNETVKMKQEEEEVKQQSQQQEEEEILLNIQRRVLKNFPLHELIDVEEQAKLCSNPLYRQQYSETCQLVDEREYVLQIRKSY